MSGNRQFADTNILVYAHDVTAGDKHSRARALVEELWDTRQGCLSVQVLQEFFVTTTRKIPKPLEALAAAQIIDDLAHWHVHSPAVTDWAPP
jgi:Predicted nucleic-acid-binding protein, contains PIN domain